MKIFVGRILITSKPKLSLLKLSIKQQSSNHKWVELYIWFSSFQLTVLPVLCGSQCANQLSPLLSGTIVGIKCFLKETLKEIEVSCSSTRQASQTRTNSNWRFAYVRVRAYVRTWRPGTDRKWFILPISRSHRRSFHPAGNDGLMSVVKRWINLKI